MAAPAVAWNAKRQQWTAEIVLGTMPGCSDEVAPCDLLIGVTSEEIYTTQENWRYAFTIRQPDRHVAIVSTARMTSLGSATWNARLRKVVAKTIALQYCGLPQSDDPRSVRYKRIMGPDNLDDIDEAVW
jgi:predicted Zn-dependent protease